MIISSTNNAFLKRGRIIMMNFKDDSVRETDVSSWLKTQNTHSRILTRFDIKFLGNAWGFHRGVT